MKICRDCSVEKELSEFDFRKDRNVYSNTCKDCRREKLRQHYKDNKTYYVDKARRRSLVVIAKNRQLVIDYLKINPCIDCGNDDVEVLQFDHRNPADKIDNVNAMISHPTSRLLKEINKCDVRCANCHTKKTRRQFGQWLYEKG